MEFLHGARMSGLGALISRIEGPLGPFVSFDTRGGNQTLAAAARASLSVIKNRRSACKPRGWLAAPSMRISSLAESILTLDHLRLHYRLELRVVISGVQSCGWFSRHTQNYSLFCDNNFFDLDASSFVPTLSKLPNE